MTEVSPSNFKEKHFTRMLNKHISNYFKSICRGLSDWRGRYFKLACTRGKLEILNLFSEMDFFLQKLYTAAIWGSYLRKERRFSFFLLYICSPQAEITRRTKRELQHPPLGAQALQSILNRLTLSAQPPSLEIITAEEQHHLLEGVPAHGGGLDLDNFERSVPTSTTQWFYSHVQPFCVQHHSWPL